VSVVEPSYAIKRRYG